MVRERVSFAARARPLRPLNGPGFWFEKVETPLVNLSRIVSPRISSGQPQVCRCLSRRSRRRRIDLGLQIARLSAMLNLSAANLIGGFVFGSIGFVAFIYGKRMNLWKPMLLGIALMVYPYFISDNIALFAVGILGSASLWFVRT